MYRQAFAGGGQTDLSSPLEFLGGLKDIEFESLACKEGFMSMPMGLRKFTLTRIAKFTKFIKQFNPLTKREGKELGHPEPVSGTQYKKSSFHFPHNKEGARMLQPINYPVCPLTLTLSRRARETQASLSKGGGTNVPEGFKKKKAAFTLAEVLITIGIIGVVAVMTLPGVITSYQERALIVGLKQAYSQIDAAFRAAAFDYGTVDTWGNSVEEIRAKAIEILPKYLKVLKACDKEERGCIEEYYYSRRPEKPAGGDDRYDILQNQPSMLLANGITISFDGYHGGGCSVGVKEYHQAMAKQKESWLDTCIGITVDVNGRQKPNAGGEDLFGFLVVKDGIVPLGTAGSNNWSWVMSFKDGCLGSGFSVMSLATCTAWVLAHENMDYKRCPEKLGWDKASSCKAK